VATELTIQSLLDENARLRQALGDVCSPLAYLQRLAEADGNRLSGMAYAIASDINTVKGIARDALAVAPLVPA
jgi:hypothetical protein